MITLTSEQMGKLKIACQHLVDHILKNVMDMNAANTYEDGADKAIRLTMAYFMKYGLLDIENFVKLDETFSSMTPEELEQFKKDIQNDGEVTDDEVED